MNMKKDFEITKINVTVLHKIQSVNGNWLPAYSVLSRATVYFKHNGSSWNTKIYVLIPEPIDYEYSERRYYSEQKDFIAEEIWEMCSTYDELKKYQNEMNGRF